MYPPMPPMGGMYPPGMMPAGMQGGMPPFGGQLNYPLYNYGGHSAYPPQAPNMHAGMSALAGAGLNAMNMNAPNYYSDMDAPRRKRKEHYSQRPKPSAEFEDKTKIVDGRDITKDNKDYLKLLLAQQLGQQHKAGGSLRPPSES